MANAAASTQDKPKSNGSSFEALFKIMLKPTGAFAQELKQAGYDIDHPQRDYPAHVLPACVEVAARYAFPRLPKNQAFRCLGRLLAQGYRSTAFGKITNLAMPMLGPRRLLMRMPTLMVQGRKDAHATIREAAPQSGGNHFILEADIPHSMPELLAGSLEEILSQTQVQPKIVVQDAVGNRFALDISW